MFWKKEKLYYHRAPFGINPESATAPKLGSMFAGLDRLTSSLNQDLVPQIDENRMNKTVIPSFADTIGKTAHGTVGLHANVGGQVASGGLKYTWKRDKQTVYYSDKLEKLEFEPDIDYISQCIRASDRVRDRLENSLSGRRRVYMITGLMIATGFRKSISASTQHNLQANISLNMSASGIPGDVGPRLSLATATDRILEESFDTKIIFAYKYVTVKQRGDGELSYKPKSGGMYSVEDDEEPEKEDIDWVIEYADEEDSLDQIIFYE
ncbi:hypothetical protein F4680DRAFT_410676 [Xylaria scruposa]|nr:hypothetical protein F4680DRAFT_410676 [Xylaria scruposa]